MAKDQFELALAAHLAEFAALRQELLDVLKWRDGLLFASLGASGALISFALSGGKAVASDESSRRLALYLVSPMSAATLGLWLGNSWRTFRIGLYIREFLAPRINQLIGQSSTKSTDHFEVFKWESSKQRVLGEWMRRTLDFGILVFGFILSGVGSARPWLPVRRLWPILMTLSPINGTVMGMSGAGAIFTRAIAEGWVGSSQAEAFSIDIQS